MRSLSGNMQVHTKRGTSQSAAMASRHLSGKATGRDLIDPAAGGKVRDGAPGEKGKVGALRRGSPRGTRLAGKTGDPLSVQPDARLEGLAGVLRRLAVVRDLESLAAVVRVAARQLTGADGVTFVLREGHQVHYVEENAVGPLWKGQRFSITACVSGWVILNRRPAVIEDIYQDSRIPHAAYRKTFVKSLAMVPIGSEEPLGAIGAYWARRHHPAPDALLLLEALAECAAIALRGIIGRRDGRGTELSRRPSGRSADRGLLRTLLRAQEEERRRIARELHDDFGQRLSALALEMELLEGELDPRGVPIRARLRALRKHLSRLSDHMQDLARGLHPRALEDLGLRAALRAYVGEFARHQMIRASFSARHVLDGIPPEIAAGLYRIAQEALHNVAKHSRASRVDIRLTGSAGGLALSVRDNGVGFTPRRAGSDGQGLGLVSMRERAALLGAHLNLESRRGRGTRISVRVPLPGPGS
jgi:two-component system CheB/CheR fusion protein